MTQWTVIIRLSSGQFYVDCTDNVETLLQKKRDEVVNGFFHHKKNRGKAKVVFCVKGDFKTKIKAFGSKKFMEVMDVYDPLYDVIGQIL